MDQSRLADIAAEVGVTVPTVSKVLNGRADVSPRTRAKILGLLEAAGYERRGSRAPGRAATKVTGVVDLVLNSIGKSWAVEVLSGVTSAAARAGCEVVTTYPQLDEPSSDWVDRIVKRGSRGVVLERLALSEDQRQRLGAAQIPCVIIDPGIEPQAGVLSVGATNWAGSYSAAQHLVSLGHARIAVIGAGNDIASRARVDGFKSALDAAGISLPAKYLRHANWTRTDAHAQADVLLSVTPRPTAIFACSDRMASGVYFAARALGLSIPDDLSVVGFDDLPEVRWMSPELTTVRQPMEEMGRTALEMLLAPRRASGAGADRVELSTALIQRGSTSAPRH